MEPLLPNRIGGSDLENACAENREIKKRDG